MRAESDGYAAPVTAAFAAAALALAAAVAWHRLPPPLWLAAARAPVPGDAAQLLFHYATLPRFATAFLAGAGLALSGAILQATLDNPLASPSTLGVSAGAELALVAVAVLGPGGNGAPREAVAACGAAAAVSVVGLIAARHRFTPATVVLGGLAVALFAGALGAALKLLDPEGTATLALWGAGSLAGASFDTVRFLVPRLAVLAALVAVLARPLGLLSLAEGPARGLGLAVAPARVAALAVATLLASSVVAAVGVIGFVEIIAPALARAAGARRFGAQAVHAAVIGGCLLVLVDGATQAVADRLALPLPTGGMAALLGAPLLFGLVLRSRTEPFRAGPGGLVTSGSAGARRGPHLPLLAAFVLFALAASLAVGRTGAGWAILGAGIDPGAMMAWRLPRALAALGAGALLGAAGALLQRLTGNPLVGPETLGLGAGAAAGLAAALVLSAAPSPATLFLSGLAGAALVLVAVAGVAARARFSPDRLLLAGVALGAALQAGLGVVLALGDARATRLLAWISGSTYGAGAAEAATALVLAAVLCPAALLFGRILDVLPLGAATASSLGVPLGAARGGVALLAAAMTAGAVETVGPLSFVGLIGPQIALRLGCRRGAAHVAGAALVGAAAMVVADALGRTLAAPFEIPAGLVAAAVGIPAFVALLCRNPGA